MWDSLCGECTKEDSLWDCLGQTLCIVYFVWCVFRRGRNIICVCSSSSKIEADVQLERKSARCLWPSVRGTSHWTIHPVSWVFTYWQASQQMWCELGTVITGEQEVSGGWWLLSRGADPSTQATSQPGPWCRQAHLQLEGCAIPWCTVASMLHLPQMEIGKTAFSATHRSL